MNGVNGSRPPLFDAALFAKVFTAVLALAVAGMGVAILVQGTIAARDIIGTLLSAVILAYWLHLLLLSREDTRTKDE